MNEKDDEVLLTVTIDENQTEARIKAINTQLNFLRDAAKGLAKDLKEGTISQKQYQEALGRINTQSALLTKELAQQKAALEACRKGTDASSGSLNEMAAKTAKAKEEYLALSKAERDNTQIGGALLKRINELNEQHEKESKKLNEKRLSIKDYLLSLNVLGVSVGDTVAAFKSGYQGTVTFAKGIATTRGALIALTAVPIVLFLTAIVAFLTKSQTGMDYLSRKTAGLTAVLSSLTKIVIGVGEKLFKAFEEGKLGATLLEAALSSVTNRLAALKLIAEGVLSLDWRKVADGVIQFGTGITNATSKAEQLGSQLNKTRKDAEALALEGQKIRDAEIKLNVERAKGQAQIEKLKKTAEDVTKSTQERENAARKAAQIENDLLQKSIALQQRKIDNLKAQAKQGIEGAESAAAIAEEEIRLQNMIGESYGKQTELNNSLNSIRQEGIEKAREAEKKAIEESMAKSKIALIQAKRNGEDILELQETIIKQQAQADLVGVEGVQARLLILKQAEADILELRTNYALETSARLSTIKESEIKTLLAQVKEGTLAELELNKALIREEAQRQKEQARATIQNKQELNAKLKQIDAESKKQLLDADKAFLAQQIALQQQRAEVQQQIANTLLARFNSDQEKRTQAHSDQIATALAMSKKGSREEHNLLLAAIEDRRARELAAAVGNKEAQERINAEKNQQIQAENERFYQQEVDKIAQVTSSVFSILSTLAEAQSQKAFAEFDKQQAAAVRSAGANVELRQRIEEQFAKKREALEREEGRRKQKFAIAEAIINTAVGVTKAAPNLFLMALAGLQGVAQIALIRAQQFAEGGVADYVSRYISDGQGRYISSGPGTTRSDSIPARISVGESIVNAKSTAMFYDQLSAMNVAGGGRAFPGANKLDVPKLSGYAMGGVPQPAGQDIGQIVNAIKQLNIFVAVTDIDSVKSDMVKAKATGNY